MVRTIEFDLFAPRNKGAVLHRSFSDWKEIPMEKDLNGDLFEYYKKLIALRKQNPALQSDNIEFLHENPEAKVLAYSRWQDGGSRVVVLANFSDSSLSKYQVGNFSVAGTWHEWMGDYNIEARDDGMVIDIGEYEAKVLVLP